MSDSLFIGKVALKRQFMLAYENIFEDGKDFSPLLSLNTVSLGNAIEQIAYLLLRLTNIHKDEKDFHCSNLITWMMKISEVNQAKVFQFINANKNFVFNSDFIFTDRRACLRLMQFILKAGSVSNNELSKSDWETLLKSLLSCNSIEINKQEAVFNWNSKDDTESFINKILPVKVRNLEIDKTKDYKVQLMKVYYFFEFWQSDYKYKRYIDNFLKFHGLKSYQHYIWNIFNPFLLLMTNNEITCKIQFDETSVHSRNFFNQFVINDKRNSVNENDDDYLLLRQYPIFKNSSFTYTVLYMNFLIDKLYQGFLWDFVSVQKKCGDTSFSYGGLKNDMGNKFSEKILFYIIMQKCFQFYGECRKTGEQLNKIFDRSEPDYFIRKADEIFVFEFKDATLKSEIKYSGDASTIKNELIEKFELSEKDREKSQNKTVNQLSKSIGEIISGKYQQNQVDDFNTDKIIIFPIFIYTDIVMEADGVNYFLKERLNDLIETNNLPKDKIKDLVLINLDTLILYQDFFGNGLIDFSDCIKSYLLYINQGEPMTRAFSFDEYFKFYIVKKGHSVVTIPEDFNNIIKSFR